MSESVYLINGEEEGVRTWYYVRVDSLKQSSIQRLTPHKNSNLHEIGEVLFSGYGDTPPNDIREAVSNMS